MSIRIPEHLRDLAPYVPGTPIEDVERDLGLRDIVKLASNENPLGPGPRAVAAIREAASRAHRYPDGSGRALRQELSRQHGLPENQIVLGNGSTELIELLAKAFLAGGGGAVVSDRAFIMYRVAVLAMNAPLIIIPDRQGRHDLEAMAAACTAASVLVYIGNPNNPTGTYVTEKEMAAYFERVPSHVLTVIDQAYAEYVTASDYPDAIAFLRAGQPVVVLRTFSKIHGLAGVRLGYALTSAPVARALESVRSPFNTSSIAQAAALAALADGAHVERSRSENVSGLRRLVEELGRRGIPTPETVTNFLLIHSEPGGQELYRRLLRHGVIVRPLESYGYRDAIRVTIGTPSEISRFLQALDAVLSPSRESRGRPGAS